MIVWGGVLGQERGDWGVRMGAWGQERGDWSVGMGAWGVFSGCLFFSRKNIFSSDDFISHMAMEEWECCIYLVDSLFRLHFLFCKSFGMGALR